jgi:hypothetical protein
MPFLLSSKNIYQLDSVFSFERYYPQCQNYRRKLYPGLGWPSLCYWSIFSHSADLGSNQPKFISFEAHLASSRLALRAVYDA